MTSQESGMGAQRIDGMHNITRDAELCAPKNGYAVRAPHAPNGERVAEELAVLVTNLIVSAQWEGFARGQKEDDEPLNRATDKAKTTLIAAIQSAITAAREEGRREAESDWQQKASLSIEAAQQIRRATLREVRELAGKYNAGEDDLFWKAFDALEAKE